MSLALITTQTAWISLLTIMNNFNLHYETEATTATYPKAITHLQETLFIALSLPSCYVIERFGSGRAIQLAMILTTIGMICRCLVDVTIWLFTVGQVLCAMASPLLFNSQGQLISAWFGPKQRAKVLSFLVTMQVIGGGVTYITTTIYAGDKEQSDESF